MRPARPDVNPRKPNAPSGKPSGRWVVRVLANCPDGLSPVAGGQVAPECASLQWPRFFILKAKTGDAAVARSGLSFFMSYSPLLRTSRFCAWASRQSSPKKSATSLAHPRKTAGPEAEASGPVVSTVPLPGLSWTSPCRPGEAAPPWIAGVFRVLHRR